MEVTLVYLIYVIKNIIETIRNITTGLRKFHFRTVMVKTASKWGSFGTNFDKPNKNDQRIKWSINKIIMTENEKWFWQYRFENNVQDLWEVKWDNTGETTNLSGTHLIIRKQKI